MARFAFNIGRRPAASRIRPSAARRIRSGLQIGPQTGERTGEPPDRAIGPGWFDSSWELVRGLEVLEGLPSNAGLTEWLALCLIGPPPSLR